MTASVTIPMAYYFSGFTSPLSFCLRRWAPLARSSLHLRSLYKAGDPAPPPPLTSPSTPSPPCQSPNGVPSPSLSHLPSSRVLLVLLALLETSTRHSIPLATVLTNTSSRGASSFLLSSILSSAPLIPPAVLPFAGRHFTISSFKFTIL